MDLMVERVDVWAASLKDQPGGLAQVLEVLEEEGADLNFILARRASDQPGTGVVFVTPLQGDKEIAAASEIGFNVTHSVHSVRVEGANQPGLGARLTRLLADAGINLRGLSAAVLGGRFILYLGLDSEADADKAMNVIEKAGAAAATAAQLTH